MSDIQRITLISDPTNEFPKNANNSFKVRLPERLTLSGEGWHASLMSLTVPDQGQSNAVIATDPHTKVVTFSLTYLKKKICARGVSTGQFSNQGVCGGIGRYYECQTSCDLR